MTLRKLTATDGVFPDGSHEWSDDYDGTTYVLPDWSIVDSPGYAYTAWGSGGRPGVAVAPSTRAGTRVSYNPTYADPSIDVSVRVWRTWNEYADLTMTLDRQAMPTVHMAENRPGSATVVVDADWEAASRHPLSPSYDGWAVLDSAAGGSSGASAIKCGMYLTIHQKRADSKWHEVWEGRIATMSPEPGRLRMECADTISVLSRQGATLRRNYYNYRPRAEGDGSYVDGSLRGSLSAMEQGGVVDPASMQWLVPQTWDKGDTIDGDTTRPLNGYTPQASYGNDYEYARWTWRAPEDMVLRRVSVHVRNTDSLTSTVGYVVAKGRGWDTESDSMSIGGTFEGWKNFDFTGRRIAKGEEVTIVMVGESSVHLAFWTGDVADDSPFAGTWRYGGDSTGGRCPDWEIVSYLPSRATGTVTGQYVEIESIEGWSGGLDDTGLVDPPEGRFVYAYYAAEAPRDDIMADLIKSHSCLPDIAGATDAVLGVYRIGGGFMSQYLQKITDVVGDDGQRRTWTARGMTSVMVASGIRHERTDTPGLKVCWMAGQGGAPSDAIEMASFNPRMTIKGRPSLAVVRGSWEGDAAMPMIVAVEDEAATADRGLCIESVTTDSGASDIPSAMRAAWASLHAEDIDAWEGTIVIPGIRLDLIERTGPNVGSGVVVAIWDPRYLMADERAIATEVKADWTRWTTEINVTTTSAMYSSQVPETAAAVQTAGDLSTGSGMLYETQYVRVVTQTAIADLTSVDVTTETSGWWPCEDVSVGYTPTRAVVTARIRGDMSHCTDYEQDKYAIVAVRVGGTPITIDPYRRPDLFIGQALIVQVDCPRSSP